jgi:hypothetical protein
VISVPSSASGFSVAVGAAKAEDVCKRLDVSRPCALLVPGDQLVARAPGARAEAEPLPVPDDRGWRRNPAARAARSKSGRERSSQRAVGGLTTREIADAFYVPEATMAQRISRAKRVLQGRRLDQPGDLAVVLRVLYLVYTAGHAGRVDLAAEAIRLARQLTLATEEPEARGLLALMLLNHARLPARLDLERRIGRTATCGTRARSPRACASCSRRWPFSAPAATRSRPPSPPCTTTRRAPRRPTPQILAWYDDLVALTDDSGWAIWPAIWDSG